MSRSAARRWPLAFLMILASCGDGDPPALTVGPVGFDQSQLLGLSQSRQDLLVGITALGLAVADSTTAELGAPLLAEWGDDRLLDILAAELTLEKNGIQDDVLRARYEVDPDWELTVRHLLVFSDRGMPQQHRDAARAKAARALEMLRAGTDFPDAEAELAAEEGHLVQEGTMPPSREGAWVPEFWAAAVALEPGEMSPVTETQYGFHVIRLLDKQRVPFDEARSKLVREVAGTMENPRAVLEQWWADRGEDEASHRTAALDEARARGLTVDPQDEAEILRRWETDVLSWSTPFGFSYGMSPEEVKQAALDALADPAQNTDIARRELSAHLEMLQAAYPVTTGTP